MFKGVGVSGDGTPLVLLGVTAENIARLKDGQPIRVNMAELGLPPMMVIIAYGETERDIMLDLEAAGVVPKGASERMPDPQPDEPVFWRNRG